MVQQSATYYYADDQYTAQVELLKTRLNIHITCNGEKRIIIWTYDQVRDEGKNTFTYPGLPKQVLRLHSSETTADLLVLMKKRSHPARAFKAASLLKVLLVIVLLSALFYIYGLPWVAGKLADRFPLRYEKQLGDRMFNAISSSFTIDEERTNYANTFFKQLKFTSHYDVKITVVEDEVVNAYAMPGGNIVVHTGLLNRMSSYEELAALLSHEFIHVENRHSLKALCRMAASRVFFALLMGDMEAAGSVLVRNAGDLGNLSYGRSLETEADENGAKLLAQRNLDCKGFLRLFQLLQKASGTEPPEYLSSHPNLNKRIQNVDDLPYCKEQVPATDSALHITFLKMKTAD